MLMKNCWLPCVCVCVCVCVCTLSLVQVFETPGLQPARLLCPQNFPGKKILSGLPFPPPEDLPRPGIKLSVSCISCSGRRILFP